MTESLTKCSEGTLREALGDKSELLELEDVRLCIEDTVARLFVAEGRRAYDRADEFGCFEPGRPVEGIEPS